VRTQPDRDRAIEQLLRRSSAGAASPATTENCVDAEQASAWASGLVQSEEAASIERHLSSCARCQALVATFARVETAGSATGDSRAAGLRWHLRWLVPLATAATIAGIWVALPIDDRSSKPATVADADASKETPEAGSKIAPVAPVPEAVPTARPQAPQSNAAASSPAADQKISSSSSKDVTTGERADRRARGSRDVRAKVDRLSETVAQQKRADEGRSEPSKQAAAAPAPASPPAPPAAVREEALATLARRASSTELISPVASHRWRIVGPGRVERSIDGGASWTPAALSSRDSSTAPDVLIAGHSPSRDVLWLVGRGGAVYVTADGTRFERLPFIEAVDLVSVVSLDDRQATVTSADGRTFRTRDRGVTWTR
jgi:hypothetical protein